MGAYDDAERVPVDAPREWGEWLVERHTSAVGVWLVTWKAGRGREHHPIQAYTKESLRFGWIDSVPRKAETPTAPCSGARRGVRAAVGRR